MFIENKYKNQAGIYMITNTETNYHYIGCSHNLFQRLIAHRSGLLNLNHGNRLINFDAIKHGIESFKAKILKTLTFNTSDRRITTLMLQSSESEEIAKFLFENPDAKIYNYIQYHYDKRYDKIKEEKGTPNLKSNKEWLENNSTGETKYRPHRLRRESRVLSQIEIDTMLATPINNRERIFINLLVYTGLRISDIVTLRVENIDVTLKTIRLKQIKTKKEVLIPISDSLIADITTYLGGSGKGSVRGWVFPSPKLHHRSITTKTGENMLKKMVDRTPLKDITPQDFRTTFYDKTRGLNYAYSL